MSLHISDTWNADSNPTRGMDVGLHFSLVKVEALRWADPQPKDYYQNVWNDSKFQNSILNRDRSQIVIHETRNNDINLRLIMRGTVKWDIMKVKVKLSLCFFLYLSTTPWRRTGAVDVQIHAFFDLGTRWRWVVSFTLRSLYPQGKPLVPTG
jgi:hypothetical protein